VKEMRINDSQISKNDLMRIIQETVPGKQITMAHVIASPDSIIYKKLGLDPKIDYNRAAIGVLTVTPSETAIIAADIAIKASAIEIGFIDRFSGTLIITGTISDVDIAFESVLNYAKDTLGFEVCNVTKA
jgi:ethanolamine utilization protein EutS